jgi:2-polyprenyl-6-hydroxyphenyl methylase/3-demethylubiquinone-9 3-methyltransferase
VTEDKTTYFERMLEGADWDDRTNTFETRRRLRLVFDDLLGGTDLGGKEFLDGGSGGGHFSAAAVARGARVTSLDVGEKLLEQVARRCDSTRVVGSILNIPFEDGRFDVVMSTEVIEHTPDPEQAVRELCRVVRPGGLLVLTSPNRLWQPVVRLATATKLRHYAGYENFLWAHHAREVVVSSGLAVERFQGFNVLPLFKPIFDKALTFIDHRLGERQPDAFVNFALRARRKL